MARRAMGAYLVALLFILPLVPSGITNAKQFDQGGAQRMITFPEFGGSDAGFTVEVPPVGTVIDGSLTISPYSRAYPTVNLTYDFTDENRHDAWSGHTANNPPLVGPDSLTMTNAGEGNRGSIASSDDLRWSRTFTAPWPTVGGGDPLPMYPYHHFKINITDPRNTIDSIYFRWEGYGHMTDMTAMYPCQAKAYFWNAATQSWALKKAYIQTCFTPSDYILEWAMDIDAADNTAFGDHLDFLVMGPWLASASQTTLATDYVKVSVRRHTETYPHDLAVDVNDDGTIEHVYEGEVDQTVTFGPDQGFVAALQHVINSSTSEAGDNILVPINLTSSTGGRLTVTAGTIEVDIPPEFIGDLRDIEVPEDGMVEKGLDLHDHFKDDYGVDNLTFEVSWASSLVWMDASIVEGHFVDLATMWPNWTGEVKFRFRAIDRFNQSVESDNVTVRVVPENDPPVLHAIGDLSTYERQYYSYQVIADDGDDDGLIYRDDTSLFDIDRETGFINFTPGTEDIGEYTVNISVDDNNGSSDHEVIMVRVENINDPPEVMLYLPTDQYEIDVDKVRLIWFGEDEDGDRLTYDLFMDSGAGMETLAGNLKGTEYEVKGLKNGTTYKWTVEAWDGKLRSKRPAPFSFKVFIEDGGGNTTRPNQPPTVNLVSPEKDSKVPSLQPSFSWHGFDPDGDALTYELSIYDRVGDIVYRSTLGTNFYKVPSPLNNFERYSWTVIPYDGKAYGICLNGTWEFHIEKQSQTEPRPPVIDVVVTPDGPVDIGTSVSFDASGSNDPDGTITLYIWSFGDGTTLTGPTYTTVDHTFSKGGGFNVSLVVFDDDGETDIWNGVITVEEEAPPPPPPPPDPRVGGLTAKQLAIAVLLTALIVALITAAVLRAQRKLMYETYAIEQAFLVYRDGRLIDHAGAHPETDKGPDDGGYDEDDQMSEKEVLGGMLTAVQEFVAHSLKDDERKGALRELEYEDYKIVLERGDYTFLATFVKGHATPHLRNRMISLVNEIEAKNKSILEDWDGVKGEIKGTEGPLKDLIS